jgi:hypothetical protein
MNDTLNYWGKKSYHFGACKSMGEALLYACKPDFLGRKKTCGGWQQVHENKLKI